MKAVRFHEYGGPEVLRYEEVERPRPGAGEVLVEVAATSFNPVDAAIRAGYLQQVFPVRLPHVPGIDVAGTVVELGTGVERFAVGDAVIGFLSMVDDGAAAQYVVAPAAFLAAAPTSIELVSAAALPVTALTAWQALFEHAQLQSGQRILVNGAGGGVGGFAVQLAKQAGAHVVATASARSADAVRAAGADEVIDYTAAPLTETLGKAALGGTASGTAGEPFDVVLSLVQAGEQEMADLVGFIRPGGVIVTAGSAAVADTERDVRAHAMALHPDAEALATLVGRVDAGEIRLDVSATYPLAEIATVHELSAAGKIRGKVVLVP